MTRLRPHLTVPRVLKFAIRTLSNMPTPEPKRPRYIRHDGTLLPFDAATDIPRHCSILVKRWPPAASSFSSDRQPSMGMYVGPTSIAYVFYTLRKDLPRSMEGRSPVDWARAYLQCAREIKQAQRASSNDY